MCPERILVEASGEVGFRMASSDLLTVDEVLAELRVPRRSWQRWRELGTGPRCLRLPNGELRIERPALDAWLASLREAA